MLHERNSSRDRKDSFAIRLLACTNASHAHWHIASAQQRRLRNFRCVCTVRRGLAEHSGTNENHDAAQRFARDEGSEARWEFLRGLDDSGRPLRIRGHHARREHQHRPGRQAAPWGIPNLHVGSDRTSHQDDQHERTIARDRRNEEAHDEARRGAELDDHDELPEVRGVAVRCELAGDARGAHRAVGGL